MSRRDVYGEELVEFKGGLHYDQSTDSLGTHGTSNRTLLPQAPRAMRSGRSEDRMSTGTGWQEWQAESVPVTPIDQSRSNSPLPSPYPYHHTHGNHSFDYNSHQSLTTLVNTPPGTIGLPLNSSKFSLQSEDAIEKLAKRDDVELSFGWRRVLFRFVPILAFANMSLYLAYLILRVVCVVYAQRKFNAYYPGAWVFLGVEIVVAIPSQLHNFWTMWAAKRRNRPKLRLRKDDVPTVDAFVTCCGEDDDVVLDTIRAAVEQDYPRDRFRIIVLDDGQSASLAHAVHEMGTQYPNVFYRSREKIPGKPHHFKAGNLNYGLEEVEVMPGGPGEFMAALDADMIPEHDWLRALLPHMLIDPKMALVCPPQLFYNTPVSDPLAQSLNFFVHVIEPIKDALGVAWCTGSGYIIRREALTEIGNFPLGSLAEDVATSTLMLGRGWKTAYIHEPLQYGTVPEDFGGHLKQRTRWAIGTIQTAAKLNFCLWGEDVKMMSFPQRFSGFLYATLGLFTVLVTISLFAIPIVLTWGKPLVAYGNDEQLKWLIRTCFAAFMSNRLCEFSLFSPAGYHTGQRDSRYQLWMSPYLAMSIVRAFFLPKWLGGQIVAFKPTGSLGSALNERDAKLKKNMFRRVWAILFNFMAGFHFIFVYFTLIAVALTTYRTFYKEDGFRDTVIGLITHAFWPPLAFLFLCSSLWTPVAYAIDPPVVPDREELLDRDHKTGVAHPKESSKKIAFGGQAAWFEFLYTGSTIYTALIFAYSFIM